MPIPHSVLIVELLMSADRVITAARTAPQADDADAWPPAVIIGHLGQVDEQVWIPRIDAMVAAIGSPEPEFTWWEPDPEKTRAAFAGASVDDAAARLLASRTSLLHRLRNLTDEQWAASARHATFGELDVEGLLIQVLGHDEEHRASLVLPDQRSGESEVSERVGRAVGEPALLDGWPGAPVHDDRHADD